MPSRLDVTGWPPSSRSCSMCGSLGGWGMAVLVREGPSRHLTQTQGVPGTPCVRARGHLSVSHVRCTWPPTHTHSLGLQTSSVETRSGQTLLHCWGSLSIPCPQLLPSNLTGVESGGSRWQQAEVHLAKVDSIVEGRQEHSPGGHHGTHQHIDGEEKEGGCIDCSPGAGEKRAEAGPHTESLPQGQWQT